MDESRRCVNYVRTEDVFRLESSFEDKLEMFASQDGLLQTEMCDPHNLTPLTPSFQFSEQDCSQSAIERMRQNPGSLTGRCLPSPESNSTFFPPYGKSPVSENSHSHALLLKDMKNIEDISSHQDLDYSNGEAIDEFSLGYDGLLDSCDLSTLPNLPSSVNSHCWRNTPITPFAQFSRTQLIRAVAQSRVQNYWMSASNIFSVSFCDFFCGNFLYCIAAVIIVSAGLVAVPFVLRLDNKRHWLHLALVVLVSAYPCALILYTPVATFCTRSKPATSGLLIKGGEYLETLSKIKILAFDKTGTITRGEFVVTDFHSVSNEVTLNTLLYWVSGIESKSSHPMVAALIDYAQTLSIEVKPERVEEFENFRGEGVHGKIDGKDVYVGNQKIALRARCATAPSIGHCGEGKSVGYIFLGSAPAGIFSLSESCRTGVREAINELKSMNIKTVMLT
ncbi:hypothetical protein RHGRI_028782 [Rhododendron griersonianum]|uniref:Uncharacterized protein n=1 Tax=Rhododendron griersonianum TaxID=479676 RepID=A0AAV6IH39_9ERIC|nr:hypothetical protein RHGRI_028782 [Rhododendron griersonianum]